MNRNKKFVYILKNTIKSIFNNFAYIRAFNYLLFLSRIIIFVLNKHNVEQFLKPKPNVGEI